MKIYDDGTPGFKNSSLTKFERKLQKYDLQAFFKHRMVNMSRLVLSNSITREKKICPDRKTERPKRQK